MADVKIIVVPDEGQLPTGMVVSPNASTMVASNDTLRMYMTATMYAQMKEAEKLFEKKK